MLLIQCTIVLLYSAGVFFGLLHVSDHYLAPALIWIVGYHIFRVLYVTRMPVKPVVEAATPFLDVSCITAGWLVVHDLNSPLWAIYLVALVGYAHRGGGFYFGLVALFIVANVGLGRMVLARAEGSPALDGGTVSVVVITALMALMAATVSKGWQGAEARARKLAETDPLTGVANRRAFHARLTEFKQQPETPFAILMLDVDNLKHLNDQYGHVLGDDVLEHVATIMASNLRSTDTLARYGGDEFIICMPGATLDEADAIAERLRGVIEEESRATVSIGCAERKPGEDVERVLSRADSLLLAAKRGGKNRIRSKNLPRSA